MEKEKSKYWNEPETIEKKIFARMSGRVKNNLSGFMRGLVVALFILIEIGVIIALPFWLNRYTVYFYVILEIASLWVCLILINDLRSPAYKVAWISICMVLPLAGEVMFLLWGDTTRERKVDKKLLKIMEHGETYKQFSAKNWERFSSLYKSSNRINHFLEFEGFPLSKNNRIDYFSMGEDLFERVIVDLERARKYIMIDFFIVAEGALWDAIHKVCLKKIKEGVEILFLYDDFGAMLRTDKTFASKLRKEGFQVAVFNPIHRYTDKLYMNYRTHQKILVIDGEIGYTGGVNIADEYANLVKRFGVWKDTGIRVEGDSVWWMTVAFLQMWEVAMEKVCMDYDKYRTERTFPENDVFCQFVTDGPLNNPDNPIETVYGQMMHYASQYLYIMTPYLVIEKDMQDALITAAKSGVDVRIITPFIPDKKTVKLLTNYNYGYLLKNGVRIFEYKPGFIHAKCILNENSVIVGSINMDYRSFYLHYENGMCIWNQDTVNVIKKDFDETFKECVEMSYEEWVKRPLGMKMKQAFINAFSTLF